MIAPSFPVRHRLQGSTPMESEDGLLHRLSLAWVTNAGCCMTWDTTGTLDSYWRQLCCFMPMNAFAATYSCESPARSCLAAGSGALRDDVRVAV